MEEDNTSGYNEDTSNGGPFQQTQSLAQETRLPPIQEEIEMFSFEASPIPLDYETDNDIPEPPCLKRQKMMRTYVNPLWLQQNWHNEVCEWDNICSCTDEYLEK
jgi:hypothetical protein